MSTVRLGLPGFTGTLVMLLALVPLMPATLLSGGRQEKATTAAPRAADPAENAPNSGTADDAPGTKVGVSLEDMTFVRRLPFDVPFYITGTAVNNATGIELIVYQVGSKAVLTSTVRHLNATSDCVAAESQPLRSVAQSSWSGTAGGAFTMLVDAIEPQRYYAFCFALTGPVPETEINKPVRGFLVQATELVLGRREDKDLPLALAQNFHDRLAEEIKRLGAARRVPADIPKGNIFREETSVGRGSRMFDLVAALVDPYQEMTSPQTQYVEKAKELATSVAETRKTAKDLLPESVIELLPIDPPALPRREDAIENPGRFPDASFDFSAATKALTGALTNAEKAKNTDAVAAIRNISRLVSAMHDHAMLYGSLYEQLRAAAGAVIGQVALEAREVKVAFGSSVLTQDMNRNAYVSLDTGIAYAWDLENMVFYAGTNIYFRPINKNASLRLKGNFFRRFALTVGVTTSVKDERRRAEDLRPSTTAGQTNSLLLGAGIRLTPSLRVGGGALIFKELDPNPLITEKSVAATPYVSFSLDINMGALLKGFFPGP